MNAYYPGMLWNATWFLPTPLLWVYAAPPPGLEDTIKIHFMLVRDALLKQCSKWLRSAISPDHEAKLRRAINELRSELDQL